jgi:hypothetical protein
MIWLLEAGATSPRHLEASRTSNRERIVPIVMSQDPRIHIEWPSDVYRVDATRVPNA